MPIFNFIGIVIGVVLGRMFGASTGIIDATLLALLYRKLGLEKLWNVLVSTFCTDAHNTTAYITTKYIFATFSSGPLVFCVRGELGGDELVQSVIGSVGYGAHGVVLFISL